MKKNTHRFLCFCLAIIMAFILIAWNTNNAIDYDPDFPDQSEIIENNYNYLADEAVDLFSNEEFLKGVKERIDNPSDDLRIVKYLMEDGTAEMRIFNEPIKYVAEDGTVHTKSTEIVKIPDNTKYGYSNLHNDVRIQFGSLISNGISLEFNGHSLYVFPATESLASAELTQDNKTVKYNGVFSDNINVEYMADYSGLKENIVIEQYAGINSFSFIIETEDTIIDNYGTIELVDKNGNNIGIFGAVFVTDANGKSIYGYSSVSKLEGPRFLYTLTVPEDYLTDSNTVYPVNVDPTFTFNFYTNNFAGYKQIYDVTLYQYGYVYQPQSETLTVSFETNYGFKRTLVKFPNLNTILKQIGEDNILFVSYSYQGLTNSTSTVYVNPMTVNWSQNATSLSNSTYDALYNGYNSGVMCSSTIHYGPGKVYFTDIAIDWINNEYSNYGIIISGMGNNTFASTENSTSYYRPYITVDYIHNDGQTVDPFEGLFKLIPYDAGGLMTDYAMKNDNSIVMTAITENVYDSDQLVYIKKETQGYTIQNPYNDMYLTSDNYSLFYSSTLASGSYWSFVSRGDGSNYIVGVFQEQINCLSPGVSGSSVSICTLPEGISNNQATTWVTRKQFNNIPGKLRNLQSNKYLTVANGYDRNNMNIFQLPFSNNPTKVCYLPIYGSQKVRPHYDTETSSYMLYLMCSENGRYRTLTWNSNSNAESNLPTITDNKFSIYQNQDGSIIIRQKTGNHLALSIVDNIDGSETGNSNISSGNIIFVNYNSSDERQKWIFEPDIQRLQEESYYSEMDFNYPLQSSSELIKSDFGPRIKDEGNFGYSDNKYKIHDGLDLESPNYTEPVYATFSGIVKYVHTGCDNDRGYFVIVESNSYKKFKTDDYICVIFQHLNSIEVMVNQLITKGTLIGYAGGSGDGGMQVYGKHLHFSFFLYSDFNSSSYSLIKSNCIHPLVFYSDFYLTRNDNELLRIE